MILKRGMQIGLRRVARVTRLGEEREIRQAESGDELGALTQARMNATAAGARRGERKARGNQSNSQGGQANRGWTHDHKVAALVARTL
jgi:hypothetical protein